MSNRLILLISFGGPRSEAEIPLFLRNLIGREPSPAISEGAARRYRAIGGSSPLPGITEELVNHLAPRFAPRASVEVAFLYSSPSIEEKIRACHQLRVEEIIFFVLSPFYNNRTTGGIIRTVQDCLALLAGYEPATIFIHSWYSERLFIEWWGNTVGNAVKSLPDASFLFSAHSLPSSQGCEPYRSQIEEAVRMVAERAGLTSYSLAWQSAPSQCEEEWIGPSVEHAFDTLVERGVKQIVQVPIGFIMDHLETLYDIDVAHSRYAQSLGVSHCRLQCPNTDPLFVDVLSGILFDRLGKLP